MAEQAVIGVAIDPKPAEAGGEAVGRAFDKIDARARRAAERSERHLRALKRTFDDLERWLFRIGLLFGVTFSVRAIGQWGSRLIDDLVKSGEAARKLGLTLTQAQIAAAEFTAETAKWSGNMKAFTDTILSHALPVLARLGTALRELRPSALWGAKPPGGAVRELQVEEQTWGVMNAGKFHPEFLAQLQAKATAQVQRWADETARAADELEAMANLSLRFGPDGGGMGFGPRDVPEGMVPAAASTETDIDALDALASSLEELGPAAIDARNALEAAALQLNAVRDAAVTGASAGFNPQGLLGGGRGGGPPVNDPDQQTRELDALASSIEELGPAAIDARNALEAAGLQLNALRDAAVTGASAGFNPQGLLGRGPR